MKRSEVSVDSLKALGYVARREFVNNWRFGSRTNDPCNERQSKELFDLVVTAARTGKYQMEIRRNNFEHTVNVYLDCTRHDEGGMNFAYYLSRPMTEAEVMEANIYTGKWDME